MNLINSNPEIARQWEENKEATKEKIMRAYFKTTIEKVKNLNIHYVREEYTNQDQFAKDIGFEGRSDHFYLAFGNGKHKDDELDELRICFSISDEPGAETAIACPGKKGSYRGETFYVPAPWSSQEL